MSTRKVKNAKETNTGELIYFKGHAKATYMSDGRTVEDAVNTVEYKKIVTTTASTINLAPNIYYKKINVSPSLIITFENVTNNNMVNEYFIEFKTSDSGTSVSLPNTIKWVNGEMPIFENNYTYHISIVDNYGVCTKYI